MACRARQYFTLNRLFEEKKLVDWCERKGVKMKAHPQYDRLRILHYKDDVQRRKIPWGTFNRFCRGLVIDLELKKIVAHPFDKFYNLGESSETLYPVLKKKPSPDVLEKLDGTFIEGFWDQPSKSWIFTTKGEFENDYARCARMLLPKAFDSKIGLHHYTIMLELIHQDFRNVIPYDKKVGYKDGLYLLGLRRLNTEEFVSRTELVDMWSESPILQNFILPNTHLFYTLDDVVADAEKLTFMDEGFVLYYKDGTMVKVKSAAYLKAHRVVWEYTDDRVLELLESKQDEILKECLISVPEEYAKDFRKTIEVAKRSALAIERDVYSDFNRAPKDSRKDFAIWVNQHVEPPLRSLMFLALDGKPIEHARIYRMFRQKKIGWRNYGEERKAGQDKDGSPTTGHSVGAHSE